MDSGGLTWPHLLLVISICACVVSGSPIGTSAIDCAGGSNKHVGEVDEGYTGDVELVTGITPGSDVKLVRHIFEPHLEFLELSFTLGETTATVRTKKQLDADVLEGSGLTLYYSIMCNGLIKYNNTRTLKINDINDNSPIFTKKSYEANVSETEHVHSEVFRVMAEDADSTPANNQLTYSIAPTSEDFAITNSGAFILQRRLNYNMVQKYVFTVMARVRENQ